MPESLRFSLLYVTALSYRGTSYESISTGKKGFCALIPARLNSVRFPGKALKQIDGIPMVVRVLAAARNSGVFDAVYAATDSPEIAAVCQTYGFEAVFTSHSHQNPTSRIQEAVTILEDSKSASSQKILDFSCD